jgi:hypothetical protein
LLQPHKCYTEEQANCLLQLHVTLKNINTLLFSTEGAKHHNFPLEKSYPNIKITSHVQSHAKCYSCVSVYHTADIFMYSNNLTLRMSLENAKYKQHYCCNWFKFPFGVQTPWWC